MWKKKNIIYETQCSYWIQHYIIQVLYKMLGIDEKFEGWFLKLKKIEILIKYLLKYNL